MVNVYRCGGDVVESGDLIPFGYVSDSVSVYVILTLFIPYVD
jgi:hypothetical protein